MTAKRTRIHIVRPPRYTRPPRRGTPKRRPVRAERGGKNGRLGK